MALFFPMSFDDDNLSHHPMIPFSHVDPRPIAHPGHGPYHRREPLEWKEVGNHFEMEVKAGGFQPEDFKLGLDGQSGHLRVSATHQERSSEGVLTSRQFTKAYALPHHCQWNEIKVEGYQDGVLKLTMPKKPAHSAGSGFEILPRLLGGDLFQGQEIHDTDETFELKMKVEGFKPEQLKVDVSPDGVLSVSGVAEEKSDDGHNISAKRIHKSFVLPKNCKLDDIHSKFTKDGQLTIQAPKDPQKCVQGNRKLSIKVE